MKRLFPAALEFALTIVVLFLALPLVAIFAKVPLGRWLDLLGSDVAVDALVVTAKTSLVANALVLGFGTPAAYLLATKRFRGRSLLVTLVEVPLVLPPAVSGIGLLAAFGNLGLLGGTMRTLGIDIAFTSTAVVFAVAFVAGPFYVRPAIAAFESVDQNVLDAARTLGAAPARRFFRIALPLAAGGLAAGAVVSFARGLGEFGATIMFAGSLQGVTQTISLAIYEQFDVDFDVALAMGGLLVVVSATLLLAVKLVPGWTRSISISPTRSAPSVSS